MSHNPTFLTSNCYATTNSPHIPSLLSTIFDLFPVMEERVNQLVEKTWGIPLSRQLSSVLTPKSREIPNHTP
jgi:hypothetical protein